MCGGDRYLSFYSCTCGRLSSSRWRWLNGLIVDAIPKRVVIPAQAGIQFKQASEGHNTFYVECFAQQFELESGLRRNDDSLRTEIGVSGGFFWNGEREVDPQPLRFLDIVLIKVPL